MICALPSERGEKRGRLAGFALGAGAIAALVLFGGQAFGQQAIAPPNVTASAVFVLNADTGQSLYQKNENKAFRILSITKLITAYVLVQRLGGQLSDTVAITQAHLVPGSTAGLRKDDVWTLENLLYGMLLVSGNDAALAVADHVGRTILAEEKNRGSSIKRFVQEMRELLALVRHYLSGRHILRVRSFAALRRL